MQDIGLYSHLNLLQRVCILHLLRTAHCLRMELQYLYGAHSLTCFQFGAEVLKISCCSMPKSCTFRIFTFSLVLHLATGFPNAALFVRKVWVDECVGQVIINSGEPSEESMTMELRQAGKYVSSITHSYTLLLAKYFMQYLCILIINFISI